MLSNKISASELRRKFSSKSALLVGLQNTDLFPYLPLPFIRVPLYFSLFPPPSFSSIVEGERWHGSSFGNKSAEWSKGGRGGCDAGLEGRLLLVVVQ